MSRPAKVLVALAVSATLAGCGDLGDRVETDRVQTLQPVTAQDLARYPKASPARTVLEWWRALQFDAPELALRHYAASAGVDQKVLTRQLLLGLGTLNVDAHPKIVSVERAGDRATVFVVLTKRAHHPNGRVDVEQLAHSFNLVPEDGEWKLADNRYLERIEAQAKTFIERGMSKQRERDSGR